MKILYITLKADNAHVLRWVQAALDRGHEARLLCLMPCEPIIPIPTEVVDTDSGFWAKSVGRLSFIWRCRRVIREWKPDLVHVHFMDPTCTVSGWRHAHPLVVSIWGSDLGMPRSPLNEWFRRRGIRAADVVVATNPLLEYMARSHVGLDADVQVIPFGVDTGRFSPGEPPADGLFHVGFVKHLEPVYGYDILIRAAALVRREVPGLRLHLVGGGTQLEDARRRVEAEGLEEVATFHGRVANELLPNLLRGFHAFAMPSRSESFGVSALEAAACGLPVVASRAGGIPDVVQDGVSGFLVPARDPAALAERLIWLARHPVEARAMGRAGRSLVESRYRWEDCTRAMEDVYRRVVSSSSNNSR